MGPFGNVKPHAHRPSWCACLEHPSSWEVVVAWPMRLRWSCHGTDEGSGGPGFASLQGCKIDELASAKGIDFAD